jgi:isopentenyl-diphosphate delta-isomerase
MKICVFSSHFGGGYGTGHSIKKEVDELVSRDHNVTVVHGERNIKKYANPKVKYYNFQYSKIPVLGALILKKQLDKIFRFIVDEGVDIFYIQTLEFGLVNRNIFSDYPLIYFARSTMLGVKQNKPKEYWLDALRRMFIVPLLIFLEKKCINYSTLVVVKSEIMKKELNELYGVPFEKIKVIRGGVDLGDYREISMVEKEDLRDNLSIKKNDKIILFAGRIVPVKGLYYLLLAFTNLIKAHPNAKLIIAGRSMMSHYHKIIDKLVILYQLSDSIIFTGYVPQNEMYKYYNMSDIVIVPSTYEPFGMVNIQAVAANKPLISSDVAGSIEVIKDYPALKIIPAFNVEKIKKALSELLTGDIKTESFDVKELLKEMSWKAMVDHLERLFQNQLDDLVGSSVTLVDDNDNEIGTQSKLATHRRGKMHRAFSIFIFDKSNRLLIQQRADHKYHSPELWSNTCCGHPLMGEKATISGRRRLKEELNMDCELEDLFSFKYKHKLASGLIENEIDHVLIGRTDYRPIPNEKEVMDCRWINLTDVRKDVRKNPQKYTYWFGLIISGHFDKINNEINATT